MTGGDTVRVLERTIDGRTVKVRLDRKDLKLDDLMSAVGKPASIIGLLAELVSEYTKRYRDADAEYRAWRASEGERILAIPGNEKLAEWKLKQSVTALPRFLEHKRKCAALEGDMEFLRTYQQAVETMSYMVSAKKDLLREGMVAAGSTEGCELPRVGEVLRDVESGSRSTPRQTRGGTDRADRRAAFKRKLQAARSGQKGDEPEDDLPY